jgi:hypothetical protein
LGSRIGAALSLYAFAVCGLFLLVAPWTAVWDQAAYALTAEPLQSWILGGWARGVVSGLGAVDLAVGAQVAAELWSRPRVGSGRPDSRRR